MMDLYMEQIYSTLKTLILQKNYIVTVFLSVLTQLSFHSIVISIQSGILSDNMRENIGLKVKPPLGTPHGTVMKWIGLG
jgi:hypothetical protein